MNYNIYTLINESVFNNLLIEAKSPEEVLDILCRKYDGHFDRYEIGNLMDMDPTKKYSYTQWALKAMSNNDEEEYCGFNDNVYELLGELFETASHNNDFQLQSFPTISAAENGLEEFFGKSQYSIVYEDEKWIIYVPETYFAERYIVWHLYDGASWCTAANSESGKDYFARYNEDGYKLYINANKETNEIYQFSPKTEEFNDKDNYGVSEFDNIGITEGALEFYKEKLGYDIKANIQEEYFEDNSEEIGNTGVYLMDGDLYLSYNEQLSDGCHYNINHTYDYGERVILAQCGYETYDIFVNQDDITGENKGWHLEYEGMSVDSWDGYGNGFYGQSGDYFGYFEQSEGWFDCIDNVRYAECIDYSQVDKFWILHKKDGSDTLFSRYLSDYDLEYTHEDIVKYGLEGFAEMYNEDIDDSTINEQGQGYIIIDEDDYDYFIAIFKALKYTDIKVQDYAYDTSQVIFYDSTYNGDGIEKEEETNWLEYAEEIGNELGLDYGVEGDIPYLLIPKDMPNEKRRQIGVYLRNKLGKYTMMPDYDENTYMINIKPKNKYSVVESIKKKFNAILEGISKNYNPDKLID